MTLTLYLSIALVCVFVDALVSAIVRRGYMLSRSVLLALVWPATMIAVIAAVALTDLAKRNPDTGETK